MEIKKATFLTSVTDPRKLPDTHLPEIVIAGKSNVGKSSFINTLANQNKLAKVGQTPGKTRMVNYFIVNDGFCVVDLPGYGFAKVSAEERMRWGRLVEGYLQASKNIKHIFLMVDIRHAPNENDIQLLQWMEYFGYPYTIVASKADKIAKSKWKAHIDVIMNTFEIETVAIPFSTVKKIGRTEILSIIENILAGSEKVG